MRLRVVVTDGVFSADPGDSETASFHSAVELDDVTFRITRDRLRHRGLR